MAYIHIYMQLGLYSFVDHQTDPHTGTKIDPQLRMQNLLEEVRLADEVGLDVFGIKAVPRLWWGGVHLLSPSPCSDTI